MLRVSPPLAFRGVVKRHIVKDVTHLMTAVRSHHRPKLGVRTLIRRDQEREKLEGMLAQGTPLVPLKELPPWRRATGSPALLLQNESCAKVHSFAGVKVRALQSRGDAGFPTHHN